MTTKKTHDISVFALHLIAMLLMTCDHIYRTILPDAFWLTCIGRLAFPIFAFLTVEGYFHTHDLKRYLLRLLCFALLSEIPFDLMCYGKFFYPYAQNVLWTFLISLICIELMERSCREKVGWSAALDALLITFFGFLLGFLLFTDYLGFGVLSVFVFYFFRGEKSWHRFGQAAGLLLISLVFGAWNGTPIHVAGTPFTIPDQVLSVLSLAFIWLYRGRQGIHTRFTKYLNYAFYPAHILVLVILKYFA